MKIGPNAQAVVDNLAGRPAEIIAREPSDVQATFRAFFSGAGTPARLLAHNLISSGHDDANRGWPRHWDRLMQIGLIVYFVKEPETGTAVRIGSSRKREVHWKITEAGWKVRMDDVAWLVEFKAASIADEAPKQ